MNIDERRGLHSTTLWLIDNSAWVHVCYLVGVET